MLNHLGESLQFGGQVMKNVAGYDLSRVMVGSFGTLGPILEISLKVLPKPREEITISFDFGEKDSLEMINKWAGQPFPISASCIIADKLYVRLSGEKLAVDAAQKKLGGRKELNDLFWLKVKNQKSAFFNNNLDLWRI